MRVMGYITRVYVRFVQACVSVSVRPSMYLCAAISEHFIQPLNQPPGPYNQKGRSAQHIEKQT